MTDDERKRKALSVARIVGLTVFVLVGGTLRVAGRADIIDDRWWPIGIAGGALAAGVAYAVVRSRTN